MSWPKLLELPYQPESACYFAQLCELTWPIFLDSGRPQQLEGRYDILSAAPYATLTTQGRLTEINQDNKTIFSTEDPFQLAQTLLGEDLPNPTSLPFIGGLMGYFAYDLNKRLEILPNQAARDINMPEMALGLYDWAIVVDHQEQRSFLVQGGRAPHPELLWEKLCVLFSKEILPVIKLPAALKTTPAQSNMEYDDYARAFARVKHHIIEGDCYQVNLAQRFSSHVQGKAWDAYCSMRAENPAPFGAFFAIENGSILSFSPERFIQLKDDNVLTMPIKGTRRRDKDPIKDEALAQELIKSEKDRAENVMIVDLLRNDLGKNCVLGSVTVPELCRLKSYPHVHHLVSTVIGQVPHDCHGLKMLRDAFPGGSITGAPKIRAMEIIDDLEPQQRSVYCGAIGYISYSAQMDTNIAIRTAVMIGENLYYWAGGGIVFDSQLEEEYQETLTKAKGFLTFCHDNSLTHV